MSSLPLLVVVTGQHPALGETFVLNEIRGLKQLGVPVVVFCVSQDARETAGTDDFHAAGGARVAVEALRSFAGVARGFSDALDYVPPTWAGFRHAIRAAVSASRILDRVGNQPVGRVHAHFLDFPALVACLVAGELGVPFSVSAHARDVFVPAYRIDRLCAQADLVLTCSLAAQQELERKMPPSGRNRFRLERHGSDLEQLVPPTGPERAGGSLRILTVARLVPKKGIDTLLEAVARLESRGRSCEYRIVGEGPERRRLMERVRALGLSSVTFTGFQHGQDLRDHYAWADVFLLGSCVAPDGDRDGVPNVLVEAQAMGVPVIASDAGGVAELVIPGETGWLVPPGDPGEFARAIEEAMNDAARRREITACARRNVHLHYDMRAAASRLKTLLAPWSGGGRAFLGGAT